MDTMLVHIVTVPFTIVVGFFLGWMARGAAGKRAARGAGSLSTPSIPPGGRRGPLDPAGR
jgi:hypothetical protein